MIIPTHRDQGLVLVTLKDLEKFLGKERASEIERTTPVIKSLAARCVRVYEVEEVSDLAIDEDSRVYDMYDLYEQSSNHVLATVTMLQIVKKSVEDLNDECQKIVNSLNINDFERRVLRKHVIEIVLKEKKGN